MTILTFEEDKKCYMDDNLNRQLDSVKTSLKKDDDYVLLIDGKERSGKSVFAQQIAKKVDPTFNHQRMCIEQNEFEYWITNAKRGQAVVFDEAYRGFSSDDWANRVARILRTKMMEMGQKNLFVIIVCPSFFLLHKYVTLHRSRGLFHVYRKRGQRGYWMFFNEQKKKLLYLKGRPLLTYGGKGFPTSSFKGRFYNQYVINEDEYRKKKEASYKEEEEESKHKVGSNKYMDQRNKLIIHMNEKLKMNYTEISDFCKHAGFNIGIKAVSNIVNKVKRSDYKDIY